MGPTRWAREVPELGPGPPAAATAAAGRRGGVGGVRGQIDVLRLDLLVRGQRLREGAGGDDGLLRAPDLGGRHQLHGLRDLLRVLDGVDAGAELAEGAPHHEARARGGASAPLGGGGVAGERRGGPGGGEVGARHGCCCWWWSAATGITSGRRRAGGSRRERQGRGRNGREGNGFGRIGFGWRGEHGGVFKPS